MFVRYTDIAYSICFQCHCRHVTFRPALLCEQSFLCGLAWLPSPVQGTHVVTGRLPPIYLRGGWLRPLPLLLLA